ncbi:glutathione S-transferase family protein [Roseiterribacter gracilis]|uniref:Glutathione S-transferase n=1 Tax=Roseiterribacter gracilis TaxID=2812848 RepID=A0A8S8XH86_9PROT|nr:glutathione S-transferase [Rhodospirillales bacterium TMPK1]
MICWTSPTTPFGRKVRMFAIEKGVADKIDWRAVDPWNDPALQEKNPIQKIPTLEVDASTRLYDSRVIVAYLETLDGPNLVPAATRFDHLRFEAMADQYCESGVLRIRENFRPEPQRSPDWIERQRGKQQRVLDALEADADKLTDTPTLAAIAVAAALGYADLRFTAEDWRATRPRLAAWHARFAQRPSYQQTMPPS